MPVLFKVWLDDNAQQVFALAVRQLKATFTIRMLYRCDKHKIHGLVLVEVTFHPGDTASSRESVEIFLERLHVGGAGDHAEVCRIIGVLHDIR